jgi:hypothetical protein
VPRVGGRGARALPDRLHPGYDQRMAERTTRYQTGSESASPPRRARGALAPGSTLTVEADVPYRSTQPLIVTGITLLA